MKGGWLSVSINKGMGVCINGENKSKLGYQLNQEIQEAFMNGEKFTCKYVSDTTTLQKHEYGNLE